MAETPRPLLLDTHVWLWTMAGAEDRLSGEAQAEIEAVASAGGVLVAAISVWEVGMLEARGRIRLAQPADVWVRRALAAPGIRLAPLSPEIALESTRLPGEPPGDPADRMLMATARLAGAALATCDGAMLAYARAGHLQVMDARPQGRGGGGKGAAAGKRPRT